MIKKSFIRLGRFLIRPFIQAELEAMALRQERLEELIDSLFSRVDALVPAVFGPQITVSEKAQEKLQEYINRRIHGPSSPGQSV